MKTALLFAGIMFPVLATIVMVEASWLDATPHAMAACSVIGMLLIFFSGRYEAASVFYLAVAMSNMKATMLPMYIPMGYITLLAYFMSAMYLALYILGRRTQKP